MKNKICTGCKIKKMLECFGKSLTTKDGLQYKCKDCNKQYRLDNKKERNRKANEKYRQLHPIKIDIVKDGYKKCFKCKKDKLMILDYFGKRPSVKSGFNSWCKECEKQYRFENKEKINKNMKEYRVNNKESISITAKKYRENNKKQTNKYMKIYREKNREKINKTHREYISMRTKNDIGFKILKRCRSRLHKAIKGNVKSESTLKLIGCSVEYLIQHLESRFKNNMTWDNYGSWEIDHIKPCALFNFEDEEEQKKCFNYKNLQPLWKEENLEKRAKY
jgi:hypothetical protein